MDTRIPQQPKPAISPTKTIAAALISTSIQIVSTYALSYILDALQTKLLQLFHKNRKNSTTAKNAANQALYTELSTINCLLHLNTPPPKIRYTLRSKTPDSVE
jgi:hypothetical protein